MDVQLSDDFSHTGSVADGFTSIATDCMEGDTLHLATIRVILVYSDPPIFQLLATAQTTFDCNLYSRYFDDIYVIAFAEDSPVVNQTWGRVKALFR